MVAKLFQGYEDPYPVHIAVATGIVGYVLAAVGAG
jgi:hypothetical protein